MAGWHLSTRRVWGPAVGKSRGGGLAQRAAERPGAPGMDGVELFGQGKWGALSDRPETQLLRVELATPVGKAAVPPPSSPPQLSFVYWVPLL